MSSISRLAAVAGLASTVVLLTSSPGAIAQEDGVFVDPDSPAGTEYQLPLARSRQHGSGREIRVQPKSAGDAPLFGEGIRRARSNRSRRAPGGRPPSGTTASRSGTRGTTAAEERRLESASVAPDSGPGPTLWIGLAVVAAGGLIGLGLRRLGR